MRAIVAAMTPALTMDDAWEAPTSPLAIFTRASDPDID
jgi:hypothetical protein